MRGVARGWVWGQLWGRILLCCGAGRGGAHLRGVPTGGVKGLQGVGELPAVSAGRKQGKGRVGTLKGGSREIWGGFLGEGQAGGAEQQSWHPADDEGRGAEGSGATKDLGNHPASLPVSPQP